MQTFLSAIRAVNADGIYLDLRQNSRGWEVHARRKLGPRNHRPESPRTFRYAVGFAFAPDIIDAINDAYLRCLYSYETLTYEPIYNPAAPISSTLATPPSDLLAALNLRAPRPPARRVISGHLRRI